MRAAESDAALFSRSSPAVSEKEDDPPFCIAAGVFGVVGVAEDGRALEPQGALGAAGVAGFDAVGVANEERSPS